MKRTNHKTKFRFSVIFAFIIAFITPNYLGLPLKIDRNEFTKNPSYPPKFTFLYCDASTIDEECLGKLEVNSRSPWHEISWILLLFAITVIIVGPYLGLLGIRFLKDQPLNKQSILNKLFRDLTKIQILFIFFWITYIITSKCIEDPQNWQLYLQLAKLISYMNEATFFHGMLYVCLIAAVRLYTIKYQVLDPLEKWFGDNEDTAVMFIRLIISSLVLIYIGIVSLTSATPMVFYKLTENDINLKDVSWKSHVKLGFNISCCIIAFMLFTAGKMIQRKHKDADRPRNSMVNATNEPREENDVSHYVSYVSFMYLSSSLFIFVILLLVYFGVIYVNIWWGLTMLMAVQGVGMPIIFLSLNMTFRNYCWRQFRGDLSNCMRWFNQCTSTIQQHNSSVSPLQ